MANYPPAKSCVLRTSPTVGRCILQHLILAIETSSRRCSVALLGPAIEDQCVEDMPRGHHDRVLPMVDDLLQRHRITLQELDAIAFGRGPGSFTGLRIGTGVTQGIAFGAGRPVVPISSLQALALGAWQREQTRTGAVVSLIDAHMKEVYCACYLFDGVEPLPLGPELLQSPAKFELPDRLNSVDFIVAGDAGRSYPELAARFGGRLRECLPEAIDVARLADRVPRQVWGQAVDAQPVYLRGADAWKSLSEQGRK